MGEANKSMNVEWGWSASFNERMGNMLQSGFRSDLTLILGTEKSNVPVNKILLQSGSRVLDMKIQRCQFGQLVIEQVDTRIFMMMLKVIFNTLQYICRNGRDVLKQDDFYNLRLECLIEIISQDKLTVLDEIEVFDAVFRYLLYDRPIHNSITIYFGSPERSHSLTIPSTEQQDISLAINLCLETLFCSCQNIIGEAADCLDVEWGWPAYFKERMRNFLQSGFRSDFTLILGLEKTKIAVHKILLQGGSHVGYKDSEMWIWTVGD